MLYLNKLREDRYLASNLSALENSRWRNVLKYQALLKGVWKPLFKNVPDNSFFYGMHRKWENGHYNLHPVCFQISEHSIGHDYLEEKDSTADKFVRCLPEEQLALYINSGSEGVRAAVKSRLKGDRNFYPIPFRQDLVDIYYSVELKSKRLLYSIELYDKIIGEHFETLSKKLPKKFWYDNPIITLAINGRVYIYQNKNSNTLSQKFLMKPETANWIFSQEDLKGNDPVDEYFYEGSQLSISKKIKWFKA